MIRLSEQLARLEAMEREGCSVLELIAEAGLNPLTDLRGGDWRFVAFDKLILRDHDLRECRLFGATFGGASVAGANFSGADSATPIKGSSGLFFARDWSDATLDNHQRLALQFRAHLQAPERHEVPVADFIRGGLLNERNYLDFMRQSGDYDVARAIYDRIKREGVAPNRYALTELILLAKNDDSLIDSLYKEAVSDLVRIDEIFLNTMADCYSRDDKASDVQRLYKVNNIKMGEYFFNILIRRAADRAGAERILTEMGDRGIPPSNVTLNSVMMHHHDWVDRKALLDRIRDLEYDVRFHDINAVLSAASTKAEVRDTLELFRLYKIAPDISTYNIRIYKRKNLNEGLAVFGEAIRAEQRPDVYTQKALMVKTETVAEVCRVMATLRGHGVDIFNEQTIRRLIRLSPDPDWSSVRVQGLAMSGVNLKGQAKALIVHWLPEERRMAVLDDIFRDLPGSEEHS